jgi:type I restriction enzyme S subunit
MGKLEQYTSYRNSGVEWLGDIPEGWEIEKLFGLCNFIRGNSSFSKDELLNNGKYVALQYGKTYKVDEVDEKYKFYVNDEYYKSSQIVNFGDTIFISTSETIEELGHSAYYKRSDLGLLGGEQILLNSKVETIDSKYLYFSSKVFSKELQRFATGIKVFRFNINDLKTIYIPLPPQEEQTKIASFLDEKTSQIDNAISQKEKLIELLKERRQITINEAVTKGLDKDVEFKDSGVEWIGEIPKHWEVEKVKYIFKDSSIKNFGNEIPLAATQTLGVVPKDMLDFRTVEANVSDLNTFKLVKENNFVISLRSFEGGIEYSAFGGIISPAYTVMEALQDIGYKYFKYLFKSNIFIQALNIYKTGIREGQNISFTKFKDDFLPLPPKDEQEQISEYIETQTSKIDKAIELQQNYIAKLKEYKASLIDSVVTGKVRVSNA